MKLSVVIATLNRLPYLRACLDSLPAACGDVYCETIVVDGGSADGTPDYLRGLPLISVEQGVARGAVAAFNAGFHLADGDYVANLNDDCTVAPNTLALACEYLDGHSQCGQVAIPYGVPGAQPTTQMVHIGHHRPVRYANFGVTRRALGHACGWWGSYLHHYGGDCELSANVWDAGYTVDELPGGSIVHYELQDSTRQSNTHGGSDLFHAKWRKYNGK
jgi:GT2 family glycosyltransferase